MKAKEISAALLLCLLLVSSKLVSTKANSIAENMTNQVEKTVELAQLNAMSAAVYHTEAIVQIWDKNSMFCKIFLHHSNVETIDAVLAEFESAVRSGNTHEIFAKSNLLCDRLSELKQLESLSLSSLL